MQPLLQQKSNKYYTFQKCVFVSLGIQQEMCMLHTVVCDLSSCTIQDVSKVTINFEK